VDHLVRFTTSEGRDAQHVAGSLDEALRFVERLRNTEEASVVKVFRMQEVPISFKTYYKVEVRPDAEDRADAPAAEVRTPAQAGPITPASAEAGEAGDGPGRKLFSRA
jgi:hypothetical protein